MILTVTFNPCVDHTLLVKGLRPHDTNRVERTETDAGGKGCNLSRIVAELGGETVATGFLGGDTGRFVAGVLDRQGVVNDFIWIGGETRTNFSVEDGSGQPPTTFNSRGPEIGRKDWNQLLEHVGRLATTASWVAIGGSLPPGLSAEDVTELVDVVRRSPAKVLVDADGAPMMAAIDHQPDLIKPNAAEAERLVGFPVSDVEDAVRAGRYLQEKTRGTVIVSMGVKGAVLVAVGSVWVGVTPHVESVSTIGSGDSMLGGFLWALERGDSVEEAFRWGLAAGAATAITDGSEIGRRPVIERLLPEASVEKWAPSL